MPELQPMPTFAEKGTETINSRLAQVRATIANFEQQLAEEKAAQDLMTDEGRRQDAQDNIEDIEESLAHMRAEEQELVAANTDTEDTMVA